MIDLIGLAVGLCVILAFYVRCPIWLRGFAIASNILFITYALQMKLWPIFLLHAILLPLNVVRLGEFTPAPRRNFQMTDEERNDFIHYPRIGRDTCAFRNV